MPGPGDPTAPRLPAEDSFLELLADTLETMELSARGQFLQRYFRAVTHLELSEGQCVEYWELMLARRRQLSENIGRPVSLKTALVDVLSSSSALRLPILIEYDDLKKLQISAATDALTGLYNRRLFEESLEKELNRARRYGHQLALVMLDLHRFKEVNDQHGHLLGDDVLRLAAATLRKTLRTSDTAFRIGGDEFALLLPQTDATQATGLSRRLGMIFEESLSHLKLGMKVGMDHGVAVFPQDGEQAEVLIRVADERLYRLKHANHGTAGNGGGSRMGLPHEALPSMVSTQPAPSAAKAAPSTGTAIPPAAALSSRPASPTVEPLSVPKIAVAPAPRPATRPDAERRKSERVPLGGTHAYAVLGETGGKRARVLDLGFGGVALEAETAEPPGGAFLAVLHVPILPPVRVTLRVVHVQRMSSGLVRLGCSFVS